MRRQATARPNNIHTLTFLYLKRAPSPSFRSAAEEPQPVAVDERWRRLHLIST
ncbi:MAG: hypothetical protein LBH84_01090 [Prevotellaceae bacterium]|nr:hypothetical protein [Prevotellaceae bacterium]